MTTRRVGQISAMRSRPVSCRSRSKSTRSHDGTPLRSVTGKPTLWTAIRSSFVSQSLSNARSAGGKVKGRRNAGNSRDEMPLRSPARGCGKEGSGRLRAVLPPRKNIRPEKGDAAGWAARTQAKAVRAARRFEANIAADTGMYFVEPVVVPDERAR